jgi:hypothetical protein
LRKKRGKRSLEDGVVLHFFWCKGGMLCMQESGGEPESLVGELGRRKKSRRRR